MTHVIIWTLEPTSLFGSREEKSPGWSRRISSISAGIECLGLFAARLFPADGRDLWGRSPSKAAYLGCLRLRFHELVHEPPLQAQPIDHASTRILSPRAPLDWTEPLALKDYSSRPNLCREDAASHSDS